MAAKLLLLAAFAVSALGAQFQESEMQMAPDEEKALEEAALLEESALSDAENEAYGIQKPEEPAKPAAIPAKEPAKEFVPAKDPAKEVKPQVAPLKPAAHLRASASIKAATPASHQQEDLKNVLTDMMAGKIDIDAIKAFAATPFGDSVQRIIDLINNQLIPNLDEAHEVDEKEMERLAGEEVGLKECEDTRVTNTAIADESKVKFEEFAPLHKTCREGENGKKLEQIECYEELSDKKRVMELKQQAFDLVDKKYADQNANKDIMTQQGGESVESYVKRISSTVCKPECTKCGDPDCGFEKTYTCAKDAKEKAEKDYADHKARCETIDTEYADKVVECNNLQDQMDANSCKRAVDMKDACETYEACYTEKRRAYDEAEVSVTQEMKDRKAESLGLQKMLCLLKAFKDGKVEDSEIEMCKEKDYDTTHLDIEWPDRIPLEGCTVPKEYPVTAAYKEAEFAKLPVLAKGKQGANECTGLIAIPTDPRPGSPPECKCERLTFNGPFVPGPVVKCTDCLDVRRTHDQISCPEGTKLFAPTSRADWKTFLSTTEFLYAPNMIVDITRPEGGCGGCTGTAMNSGGGGTGGSGASSGDGNAGWVTQDGSPWWLRSQEFEEPNDGGYVANCYLSLFETESEDAVSFKDSKCDYHSKSYFCQLEAVSLTPTTGSPEGCVCEKVALTGPYSAKALIKCSSCLDVSKSAQANSCPEGTKLFSPASVDDWKTFIDSAEPLNAPNWIIDVTRPQDGCGGCDQDAMNHENAAQKTWVTSDGTPWWLRASRYSEPNADYKANCYLDLFKAPDNENTVFFKNTGECAHANTYYCQPKDIPPVPAPPPPPAGPCPSGYELADMFLSGPETEVGTGMSNDDCAKACNDDSKCLAYMYHYHGSKMCKTKSGFENDADAQARKQDEGWQTCIRTKCAPGYTFTEMDYFVEADYTSAGNKDTSVSCGQACDADGACLGYEWNALNDDDTKRGCVTKNAYDGFGKEQDTKVYTCIRGSFTPPSDPCPAGFEASTKDLADGDDFKLGDTIDHLGNGACAKKCEEDDKCVAYEVKTTPFHRDCNLKKDLNPSDTTQGSDWQSCIRKKCPGEYEWTSMDLTDDAETDHGKVQTSLACAQKCDGDSSCRGYEWFALGGDGKRTCKTKSSYSSSAGTQNLDWYSCTKKSDCVKVDGKNGDIYVPTDCGSTDYQCQAKAVCDHVSGENCAHQSYDCYTGVKGSYYPPSSGGSSNYNFAYQYDFGGGGTTSGYGNICDCAGHADGDGLYTGHQNCGKGRWHRGLTTCGR